MMGEENKIRLKIIKIVYTTFNMKEMYLRKPERRPRNLRVPRNTV